MVYSEKRIGLMESILVDVKMAMESVEDTMRAPMPMTPPFTGASVAPKPSEKVLGSDSTEDDQFYAQLLKEVTEEHAAVAAAAAAAAEPVATAAEPVESTLDAQLGAAPPAEDSGAGVNPTPAASPYDAMSRQDLLNLLEKRGLRVTKRAGRGEMISVLRNSDATANRSTGTGTDDGSKDSAPSLDSPAPLAEDASKPLEEVLSV